MSAWRGHRSPPARPAHSYRSRVLEIVYQDASIVAIHKPAGLLVHRSMLDRHETRFAVQLLRDQLGRHVHPAHRLDKGTSGLLLFGLTREVAAALGRAFEAREVEKRYLAIVRGHPPLEAEIDHPLLLNPDRFERGMRPEDAQPQTALTRYRRLATVELQIAVDRYPSSRYALLLLDPLTGRRHQLRRHMKHVSHPIIGDATFGKGRHNRFFAEHFGVRRLLLACVGLSFRHPLSGEKVQLTAPPSSDFRQVVAALGWSSALDTELVAAWQPILTMSEDS